jgi:hypothetical protein
MLQHQEAAQEGLLPAAHKVTWSVLFIYQKGKEGGGATGNNSVCTNHCSPSSYSWRIVFVPITAQPLSPVTRLLDHQEREVLPLWSSNHCGGKRPVQATCWGSALSCWSCALGSEASAGMRAVWLLGWQPFAQGSQGPRARSNSCHLRNQLPKLLSTV